MLILYLGYLSNLPKQIEELANSLTILPGIGPKTAGRLAIYLATSGQHGAQKISDSLANALENIVVCETCANLANKDICQICQDQQRQEELLLVVETVNDLIQIEQSHEYHGYYVVCGGLISPLSGVAPDDLNLHLIKKALSLRNVEEVVLGLTSTVEGEATSMFIRNMLRELEFEGKITQFARGLPSGSSVEYLDSQTIKGALAGRRVLE